MKKFITCGIVAALCTAALSTQVFAADILSDRSVYAADQESIAKAVGNIEWKGEVLTVDPDTIMPFYYVNFIDYARTGNFNIIPFANFSENDDCETFVADVVNENGDFAGTTRFTISGKYPGHSFVPSTDKAADSVAFAPNARRISALMAEQNISSDCKEVKYVVVEGICHGYYIDNGKSKYLAAANGEASAKVFNYENGGIVEINDDLKAIADQELAEYEKYKTEVLDKLAPGEPPPVGLDLDPVFKVDNTPYLNENDPPAADNDTKIPNTGDGTAEAVGAAVLMAAAAGAAVVVNKKRKDD